MDGRKAETRRQHAIMVTDSEWRRLTLRAKAAGMPVSRFIVHRLAGQRLSEERDALAGEVDIWLARQEELA